MKINDIKVCCICHCEFTGWGNNPWPVNDEEDARCCDACNEAFVVPARISRMFANQRTDKNQ